jgi:hypothetical protein
VKFQNNITGDVLEVPPPDEAGRAVVLLNGQVLERVVYGEDSVTLEDGRTFPSGAEFAKYLAGILRLAMEAIQ